VVGTCLTTGALRKLLDKRHESLEQRVSVLQVELAAIDDMAFIPG
jgi:hypothetical protein